MGGLGGFWIMMESIAARRGEHGSASPGALDGFLVVAGFILVMMALLVLVPATRDWRNTRRHRRFSAVLVELSMKQARDQPITNDDVERLMEHCSLSDLTRGPAEQWELTKTLLSGASRSGGGSRRKGG